MKKVSFRGHSGGTVEKTMTTPGSKLSLSTSNTPETPHVYLFSPSSSSPSPSPEAYCNGHGSNNNNNDNHNDDENLSLCLLDKQAEITSLRHKIQCMEAYESDLVEELKIMQDENDGLQRKLIELKKSEDSSDHSFVIQSCSSPIGFDYSYASDFDSKLSEELSKSKANLSVLEDRNYELVLAREEAVSRANKKDEMIKELKEEMKLLQQELWESLREKQALVADVTEKVSIIESLQNHCEELKEMLDQRKHTPNKLVTPVGVIKYFHPNRSLNSSSCGSGINMSISEEPLDLGMEVIDLQLQEAKEALALAEENLKICEENLRIEVLSHEETSKRLKCSEEKKAELETYQAKISKENLTLKSLLFDPNNNGSSAKVLQLQASNNDLDAQKKELNFALKIAFEELIMVHSDLKNGKDTNAAEKLDAKKEKVLELNEELKYLRKENDLKLWDLQVAHSSIRNLEENLAAMHENWVKTELKLKRRGKKIDKGISANFGNAEELLKKNQLILKFQERIKLLEKENRVQMEKLKDHVAQESKEKYRERFETYRKQVASIVKQEGDATTKLKKKLADADGRILQLENEIDALKRELGQLRRDYKQSQLTIHSMKDKEKHAAKSQKLPDPSKKSNQSEAPKKSVQFETPKKCTNYNRYSSETPSQSLPASPAKSSPRCSLPASSSSRFDEDFFMTHRLRKLSDDRISLDDDRKTELCRRNSMVPPHMKSCYPMEYIVTHELEVETLFKPPISKMTGFARKVETVTQSAPSSPMTQRRNAKIPTRLEKRT